MKTIITNTLFLSCALLFSATATSGPLDPECSAKKTAKSAAMKSTIGVGGRCKPADAAKDAVGLDDKKGKKNKKSKKDKDGMFSNDDDNDKSEDGLFSKDDSDDKKSKKNKKDDKDGFGLKKKAVKTVL